MSKAGFNSLAGLYCNIWAEVIARQTVLSAILSEKYKLPRRPAFEHCQLQIRMISELIAIGCLVAHGEIEATRTGRMRSAYAADWILNALEKLHPHFFPFPTKEKAGNVLSDSQALALTKGDVLKAYTACGRVLHRGSIKTFGAQSSTDEDFRKIQKWIGKLMPLLDQHAIVLAKPEGLLWAVVEDPNALLVRAYLLEPRER